MLKHKDFHFKIISNRDVQTKSLVTKEVKICRGKHVAWSNLEAPKTLPFSLGTFQLSIDEGHV